MFGGRLPWEFDSLDPHQSTCLSVEPGTRFPAAQRGRQSKAGVWIFFRSWVRRTAVDAVFGGSEGHRGIAILGVLAVATMVVRTKRMRPLPPNGEDGGDHCFCSWVASTFLSRAASPSSIWMGVFVRGLEWRCRGRQGQLHCSGFLTMGHTSGHLWRMPWLMP